MKPSFRPFVAIVFVALVALPAGARKDHPTKVRITLGFGIRTMVGVGAFGFNVGVFATVRFGESILIGPIEAYACKRGTIDGFIDSGVGYQLPKAFTVILNFFITTAGGKAIDPVGTIAKGPSFNLFSDDVSVPSGCATAKTG